MRILGIDPGSKICGYGVVDKIGNKLELIEYGVVKIEKIEENFNLRLNEIHSRIFQVIIRTKPEAAAVESLFYLKNVQSLVKLSHARAVAILAAVQHSIPISEYSPREVKKSVTGNGNASKEQVQYMVKSILKMEETPEFFDATDALAVAICHSLRFSTNSKSTSSWSEFIKKNPDRVVGKL